MANVDTWLGTAAGPEGVGPEVGATIVSDTVVPLTSFSLDAITAKITVWGWACVLVATRNLPTKVGLPADGSKDIEMPCAAPD